MMRPELCIHYSSSGVSGGVKESCLAQIIGLRWEITKTNYHILVYQVQIYFSCMKRKPRASCLTGLTLTHLGEWLRGGAWPCGLDSPEGSQCQSFLTSRATLPEAEGMDAYLLPARSMLATEAPQRTKNMHMMN